MNSDSGYILNYSRQDLYDLVAGLGEPSYRADQIFNGLYVREYERFEQFSTLPKTLRTYLDERYSIQSLKKVDAVRSPHDGTTKFLWRLHDGKTIESVIIYEGDRVTFCISSQVGCPLDCQFCATGRMGLIRNLMPGEIVEQVLQMQAHSVRPATNIVFMGMGEPFLNYRPVMQAAHTLSDPGGLCFSRKKITISTSGVIKHIYRMADEQQPFSLAISLNATNQKVREQIMPMAKNDPLDALLEAARYYVKTTDKRITFEYVLIKNVNASAENARELIKLTHGIPCKINLIPCNSDLPQYQPPEPEDIEAFDRLVNDHQRTITVRNRKGWEIQAACGQLYTQHQNRRQKRIPLASESIQFPAANG